VKGMCRRTELDELFTDATSAGNLQAIMGGSFENISENAEPEIQKGR
jgi:hypothetical protein